MFLSAWSEITSDKFVLSVIKGYKLEFDSKPKQSYVLPERSFSPEEIVDYEQAIGRLLAIGAIRKCSPCKDQFISPYFLVDKSNGSKRLVFNLKGLNKFMTTEHFKLEDVRTAIRLLSKGVFMAKLDLQDAYLLISIHPESRKYLRLCWKGQLYEYLCMPFGLCTAPFIFTKIMKPLTNWLRERGWLSVVYLDDWLCLGSNFSKCSENVSITVKLLESLGFILNLEKSMLKPDNKCEFLGFVLNSLDFRIELPDKKRNKLLKLIREFKQKKFCKIRDFASFVGNISACCLAVEYGWVYSKQFERQRYLALLFNDDNYDAKMKLETNLQSDFLWWESKIKHTFNPIRTFVFKKEIFSDASLSGWGAFCENELVNGFWKDSERDSHINYLELAAAFFALKVFSKNLVECEILLRIDNTTAISYINRMGGIQYPKLNQIAREIWQWCENRRIWIFASYIASRENTEADRGSRIKNIDTEWELSNELFTVISNKWGPFDIDLFATRCNTKCQKYCSWHRDPEAYCIDAFTLNWSVCYFYAFPPFSIILRVLKKIESDQAQGILIVPNWSTQPWYPLFNSLLIEPPIVLNPSSTLLLSPDRSVKHPLAGKLSLIVGKLSGRPTDFKECQKSP